MKSGLFFALAICICLPAALAADTPVKPGEQAPQTFEKQITIKLDYLLYLPADYGKDVDKKWPLIMFLHGSGERGSDVNKVKVHGPPKLVSGKDDPMADRFIVVSPQCPDGKWWNPDDLNMLLKDVTNTYHIDPDRLYLTGLSMGGFGTWDWAVHDPGRFAAIAPMCGGGDPQRVRAIKSLPVWVFHGEKDPTVPIQRSQDMVDALKKAGNEQVKFTRYPEAGHDCWTASYANPELYSWFLEHKRQARAERRR
jgi:predicted peptidase